MTERWFAPLPIVLSSSEKSALEAVSNVYGGCCLSRAIDTPGYPTLLRLGLLSQGKRRRQASIYKITPMGRLWLERCRVLGPGEDPVARLLSASVS